MDLLRLSVVPTRVPGWLGAVKVAASITFASGGLAGADGAKITLEDIKNFGNSVFGLLLDWIHILKISKY